MSTNFITSISTDQTGRILFIRSRPGNRVRIHIYQCSDSSLGRLDQTLRERVLLDLGTPRFFRSGWMFVPWYVEELPQYE